MSDNSTKVTFEVDADAWDTAKDKAEWGEMSERLRKTVEEKAYGTEVTERKRLKEKLENLRQEKREYDTEIDGLRADRDEVSRKISRIEDRLDTLMQKDGEYEGFLQSIEEDLHEGVRFDPQNGKIERASELGECDPADVIETLKERNPDVPDQAFELPSAGESPNWKDGHSKAKQ